jgi:hypothetical protein
VKAVVRWISVLTRRPPNDDVEVLFVSRSSRGKELHLGYYTPRDDDYDIPERWRDGEWTIDNVTHWARKPALPR